MSAGHFQCVYTIRFSEPTKIGSLKTDSVNGPLKCLKTFHVIFLSPELRGFGLLDTRDSGTFPFYFTVA